MMNIKLNKNLNAYSTVRKFLFIFIIVSFVFFNYNCQSEKPGAEPSEKNLSNKKVIAVIPVTIDAITDFLKGMEEVLAEKGVTFEHLSAEGDSNRFETVIKTAIFKKPDVLAIFGTQMTDIAVGSKFRAELPVTITGPLSKPDDVAGLREIGIDPPRKLPIAIVGDNPIISYYKVAKDMSLDLLGSNKKIGILYTKSDLNAEVTAKSLAEELTNSGYTVEMGVLTKAEDASMITKSLILKGVEAIYLPHDKNVLTKASTIVKLGLETEGKKIPIFSLDEGSVREKGVVASASVSYFRIGKMTADIALEIMNGKNAAQIPVRRAEKADIYINIRNLNKYELKLPEDLKNKAILFDVE
jgi:putative ABC transport system substrate-binding protein